jgi:hypothetical protein
MEADVEKRLLDAATRMSRRCRWIIQSCLREEEWQDADAEFFAIILAGLKEIHDDVGCDDAI